MVRTGLRILVEEYRAARLSVEHMRGQIAALFWEYPAILTPAATGPAQAGFEGTGDAANNAPWSALCVPAISTPLPLPGAPLGLQMAAAWGRDDALVAVAAQVEELLSGASA